MKKNKDIEEREEEKFFKDKIINLTSMQNSFLQMPTMICFNFCLKEMLDLCNVNSETGNKKYFELAKDFRDFLKKDIILKELDMGTYINIIKKIKEFLDDRDKINCIELYNYFSHVRTIFSKKYIDKLIEVLLNELQECNNYKKLEILIETLINELLSLGYTYKFLNEIVKSYVYDNIFENPSQFINFLFNSKENYDIYIPLLHFNKRDERFLKNSFKSQDVQLGKDIKIEGKDILPDKYYCHIYFNNNDYYKGISKQLKRMKSIFNFEKFYIGSKIDFDENENCIIKANKYLNIEDKSLNDMFKYDYYKGTHKIIDSSISTLRNLTGYYYKEEKDDREDSKLVKDFFNIIDYSEKSNNILSTEQFINKWIALETLYSKSPTKSGFDSILNYMPIILAIDLFRKKLNVTLKRTNIGKGRIEEFIKCCYDDSIDTYIKKVKGKYFQNCIYEFKEIISNPHKLNTELNKIIERIRMSIYRIYIFRNRYVHTGETKSYYDIPQYLLCQTLALSIDKFMKSINDLDKMEIENITWDKVFNSLLNKYLTVYNALKILSENSKIDNNFILTKENILKDKDSEENIIVRILLEKHINVFEKVDKKLVTKKFYYMKKRKFSKLT